jgi:hypothetical protein
MNTYININNDTVIYKDCVMRDKGDVITIAFEDYEVISVMWEGAYDYTVEVFPVREKTRFIN